MNDNNLSNDLLKALKLQYEAEIQAALATLKLYLHKSVGIGEHPQHLEEMDKLVEKMASSNDKLEILHRHFTL
jgi:hypothetical protein